MKNLMTNNLKKFKMRNHSNQIILRLKFFIY